MNDPSISLCISADSLKEKLTQPVIDTPWYFNNHQDILISDFKLLSTDDNPLPEYVNQLRYNTLQKVKKAFSVPNFIEARNKTNPFEEIPRSIFINIDAVKLANIDSVLHVSNEIFTFDHKQSDKQFTFCDVASGPGGFTQYLQYRFPNSYGYGMTLLHPTLDWNKNFLDMKRFEPFYGPDNTGNLYTNCEHFIKFVLNKSPAGVDLVTADGDPDIEDNLYFKQEFLLSRLLTTQALIGIGCTKIGGNFVLKVFDTVTDHSAQIIYILSLCFEKILYHLYK
jgi:cap1 methyltransferase